MMSWWCFVVPLIGGFTGWLLTSAVVVLYSRRLQKRLSSLLAGQSRNSLASAISKIVGDDPSFFAGIEQQILNPANLQKIMPVVEEHIDIFLRQKLKTQLPAIGSLIGERTILQLKEIFIVELKELFPIVMKNYTDTIKNEVNTEKLIGSKLVTLPVDKVKSIITPYLSVELRQVKLYGTILGFLIGTIQVIITCYIL